MKFSWTPTSVHFYGLIIYIITFDLELFYIILLFLLNLMNSFLQDYTQIYHLSEHSLPTQAE